MKLKVHHAGKGPEPMAHHCCSCAANHAQASLQAGANPPLQAHISGSPAPLGSNEIPGARPNMPMMRRKGRLMARLVKDLGLARQKAPRSESDTEAESDAQKEASAVGPGSVFVKTWRVRNDSPWTWPENVELVFIGGDKEMLIATTGAAVIASAPAIERSRKPGRGIGSRKWEPELSAAFPVQGGLAPGAETVLECPLQAPEKPGRYECFFRLREKGESGAKFGQRLFCSVHVEAQSSSTSAEESEDCDSEDCSKSDSCRKDPKKPSWELGEEKRFGNRDASGLGKARDRQAERRAAKLERLERRKARLVRKIARIEEKIARVSAKGSFAKAD